MSIRGSATARAADALFHLSGNIYDKRPEIAEAVVAAIYPEIYSAKQMVGVPKGSILVGEHNGPLVYEWTGKQLLYLVANAPERDVDTVINNYGPLTVVWMP